MSRVLRFWIVLAAVAIALLPGAARAAAPSFSTPSGLQALPSLNAVTCPSAPTCVAVGGDSAGTIVTTSDGGRHWTALDVVSVASFSGVSCVDSTHCVAVGSTTGGSAAIAVTRDGRSWSTVISLPTSVPLNAVSCVALRCMAVGGTYQASTQQFISAAIFSFDGGATWAAAATPAFQGQQTGLYAVDCPTAQRCYTEGGYAWVTDNFGGSWREISPPNGCSSGAGFCLPTYSLLDGLAFADANHGAVAGGQQCGGQGVTKCNSAYFSTSDGGASWTMWPAGNGPKYAFIQALGCNANICVAASDSGTTSSFLLTSDGLTFTTVGSTPGMIRSIACSPGGPCVAVGANGPGILLVATKGVGPGKTTTPPAPSPGGAGGASNAVVSSFSTSIPTPSAVASSAPALLLSALLVLALVLLVVFPSQLFNRTYEENHERIVAWWKWRVPWTRGEHKQAQSRASRGAVALASAVLVGAALGTLLGPKAGFNTRTTALFTGIVVSFLFSMTLGAAVTAAYRRARRLETHWRPHALPSGLLVAAICVLVSRVVGFQPGYLYGIIGGVAFAGALSSKQEGHLIALSSAATLVVAVIAWLLWVPVSTAAARPGAGFGMALLSNVLSALFVGGLAGVVLGLIPLRFLPGEKLAAWHWGAWAAVFAVAMFGLVQIMLRPQSSSAHVASVPLWTTVGLFLAFGAASVAFWGYFRATARQEAPPG